MLNKLLCALAGLALVTANASAGVITYTNRAAFEAAVGSFTTDNLDNVQQGSLPAGLNRGNYAFTMNSYGCVGGPGECGDNQIDGFFYPAYIWTYGSGSFNFTSPIYAFGLNYGDYERSTASVTLNGYTASTTNGGFFGIN